MLLTSNNTLRNTQTSWASGRVGVGERVAKDNIRNAWNDKKQDKLHLNRLARKRWGILCSCFVPRWSLTRICVIVKPLKYNSQQPYPFQPGAFSRQVWSDALTNFCANIARRPATVQHGTPTFAQTPPYRQFGPGNVAFILQEIEVALSSWNSTSSQGPHGAHYPTLCHFRDRARSR